MIFIAVALFFAVLAGLNFPTYICVVIAAVCIAAAVALYILRARCASSAVPAVSFCAAALGIIYAVVILNTAAMPLRIAGGSIVHISGTVSDEPISAEDSAVYVIDAESVDGRNCSGKIKVYSSLGLYADPLDRAEMNVVISSMNDETRLSNYADGIFAVGYAESGEIVHAEGFTIKKIPIIIRRKVKEVLYENIDNNEAGLLCGITLGDKTGFTELLKEQLRKCGISHVAAVSGLHLSIICCGIMALLKRLRIKRAARDIITLAAALIVTVVAGFTPSVCRAALMLGIMLFGDIIMRKPDTVNSLGISAIVIIALNPFCAADVSFQLSFAATAGLLVLSPLIYNKIKLDGITCGVLRSVWQYLAYGISASLSAVLFTLPVSALTFTKVSLIAPLGNLLCVFAASGSLVCAVIAIIFYSIPLLSFIGFPFLAAAGLLAKYIVWITGMLNRLPITYASFATPVSKLGLAAAIIFIAAALIMYRRGSRIVRVCIYGCAAVVLTTILSYNIIYNGSVEIAVIDARGMCCITTSDDACAVIGCGDKTQFGLKNYLSDNMIEREILVLQNLNDTFAKDATASIKNMNVTQAAIAVQGKYADELAAVSGMKTGPAENCHITLGENYEIDVIPTSTGNNTVVSANGRMILIPTGSLDINELPEEFRLPDIIICTRAFPESIPESAEIVLAGTAHDCVFAATSLGRPVYATAENGGLNITINKNGNYFLRRES